MIGQAIWVMGELRVLEVVERIMWFLKDKRQAWIYDNEVARTAKISDIAKEAMGKLFS